MSGRQSQKHLFRTLNKMTQSTHCYFQTGNAKLDFHFPDILVRVPVGPHVFWRKEFWGPARVELPVHRKSCLLAGVLKTYNGEGTGKVGLVINLASSLYAGL